MGCGASKGGAKVADPKVDTSGRRALAPPPPSEMDSAVFVSVGIGEGGGKFLSSMDSVEYEGGRGRRGSMKVGGRRASLVGPGVTRNGTMARAATWVARGAKSQRWEGDEVSSEVVIVLKDLEKKLLATGGNKEAVAALLKLLDGKVSIQAATFISETPAAVEPSNPQELRESIAQTTLFNAQKALWEALRHLVESGEGAPLSEREHMLNRVLYGSAAVKFCREYAPGDAVERLAAIVKACTDVLPPAQQVLCDQSGRGLDMSGKTENSSRDIFRSLGLSKPRHERKGWKEKLESPGVQGVGTGGGQDSEVDEAILMGRMGGGGGGAFRRAVLAEHRRSVRFLFSSTFTDTNEERNTILADVMPYLQEVARGVQLEVTMVEMRWGIRSEASRAHETTKRCMQEVQRASRESLGVSYVLLLTQKYGFRTLPASIPQEYFESLLNLVPEGSKSLVKGMYTLDENALRCDDASPGADDWCPPEEFCGPEGSQYVLRSKAPDMTEAEFWRAYGQVQDVLRDAARQLWETECRGLRDADCKHFAKRLFISVTEEEMSRGMLWRSKPNQLEGALVYRRTFQDSDIWAQEQGAGNFIDLQKLNEGSAPDLDAQMMLEGMRKMVPKYVNRREYTPLPYVTMGGLNPNVCLEHKEYLKRFADDFCVDMMKSIYAAAAKADQRPTPLLAEVCHHLRFALNRAEAFYPTESTNEVVARLVSFLDDDVKVGTNGDTVPNNHDEGANVSTNGDASLHGGAEMGSVMVLHGLSGSGKTYLMSHAVRRALSRTPSKGVVVVRFLGTSPESSSVSLLLTSLLRQLRRAYAKEESQDLPADFVPLAAAFERAVREWPSEEMPLTIVLDSVDQLDDSDAGRQLDWLPVSELPKCVKMIVSSLPDHAEFDCLSKLRANLPQGGQFVGVLPITDHEQMLEYLLRKKGRKISNTQMEAVRVALKDRVYDSVGTPLWLNVVAESVSEWRSFDGVRHAISPHVVDLIKDHFSRAEKTHGVFFTRAVLAYLFCSRGGLAESELQHLLNLEDDVLADTYEWWVPPLRIAPPHLLSKFLEDNQVFLARRGDGSGRDLLSWYHRQFWESCESYCFSGDDGEAVRAQRHKEMADYFGGVWAGKSKPYNVWLSSTVQRPHFFPGETGKNRHVPHQKLVLRGSLVEGGASLVINLRRIKCLVPHLICSLDESRTVKELVSTEYIAASFASGAWHDLFEQLGEALATFPSSARTLSQVRGFIGRHMDILRSNSAEPSLVAQLVVQEPANSELLYHFRNHESAKQLHEQWQVVEWPAKPQVINPCHLSVRTHERQIHALDMRSDGKILATGGMDGAVKLVDAVTGQVVRTLLRHSEGVEQVRFKGMLVAASNLDKTIRVWTSDTGELLHTMARHNSRLSSFAFVSKSSIVSSDWGGNIICWDARSGAEVVSCKIGAAVSELKVDACSKSHDQVVLIGYDQTVWSWGPLDKEDVAPPHEIRRNTEVQGNMTSHINITCHPFLPNLVGIAGRNGMVSLLDTDFKKVVWESDHNKGMLAGVESVSFAKDGRRIASCAVDNLVKIWSVRTGRLLTTLSGHSDYIRACVFSPDGNILVSGGADRDLKYWDVSQSMWDELGERELLGGIGAEASASMKVAKTAKNLWLSGLSWSASGERLASACADGQTCVWHVDNGTELARFEGDGTLFPTRIRWHGSEKKLYRSGMGDCATPWEEQEDGQWKQQGAVLKHEGSGLWEMRALRDGKTICTLSSNCVFFWDVDTASVKRKLPLPIHSEDGIAALTFDVSPDMQTIVCGLFNGQLILFDVESGELQADAPKCHTGIIAAVVYSPSGFCAATASEDGLAKVFLRVNEKQLNQRVVTLAGHEAEVRCVSFVGEDRVATGSNDKTVRVWDAATGAQLQCFRGHSDRVYSVATQPNGHLIASGCGDGIVTIWDLDKAEGAGGTATDSAVNTMTDGGFRRRLVSHSRRVTVLCFSSCANYAAMGMADKKVKLWQEWQNTGAFRQAAVFTGHTDVITAVGFSMPGAGVGAGEGGGAGGNDPLMLASGSYSVVNVWDVEGPSQVASLVCQPMGWVGGVGFTSHKQVEAVCSDTGKWWCWDVTTGQCREGDGGDRVHVRTSALRDEGVWGGARIWAEQQMLHIRGAAEGKACFFAGKEITAVARGGNRVCVGCVDGSARFLRSRLLEETFH